MFVYRLSKKEYINDFTGVGAGLYGGRWNPKGINLVYTSGSIALACLEFLIHNYHTLSTTRTCLAKIEISTASPVVELDQSLLPSDWNLKTKIPISTQQVGKNFVVNDEGYVLKVPSAIVPGEYNFLLNPRHENHPQTKIVDIIDPFTYDERLLGLLEP